MKAAMRTTYILTAELDEDSFAWLNGLRQQHFAIKRNFLPAHLTLFHRLTEQQVDRFRLLQIPAEPLDLRFHRLFFLGFGVAIGVQCTQLHRVRSEIRDTIGGKLFAQDTATWKPHVTIQNKVSAEAARELHQSMRNIFVERTGAVLGLLVWEYLGGPWKLVHTIKFKPV